MKISMVEDDTEYTFTFDKHGVLISNGLNMMVMPLDLIRKNAEPWQYLKNEYIKIPKTLSTKFESICMLEGLL